MLEAGTPGTGPSSLGRREEPRVPAALLERVFLPAGRGRELAVLPEPPSARGQQERGAVRRRAVSAVFG